MTRIILKFLNSPFLILMAFIGVAIQTSFFTFWILPYLKPDIVLLFVLHCALRRSFLEGGIITLILGNLTEIHSAAPRGLHFMTYMAIYLLVRLAARILVIPDLRFYILATGIASITTKVFSLTLVYLLGMSIGQWNHILFFMIPGALINGVLGRFVFDWLNRFDRFTYKHIPNNRFDPMHDDSVYMDDEYPLETSEI